MHSLSVYGRDRRRPGAKPKFSMKNSRRAGRKKNGTAPEDKISAPGTASDVVRDDCNESSREADDEASLWEDCADESSSGADGDTEDPEPLVLAVEREIQAYKKAADEHISFMKDIATPLETAQEVAKSAQLVSLAFQQQSLCWWYIEHTAVKVDRRFKEANEIAAEGETSRQTMAKQREQIASLTAEVEELECSQRHATANELKHSKLEGRIDELREQIVAARGRETSLYVQNGELVAKLKISQEQVSELKCQRREDPRSLLTPPSSSAHVMSSSDSVLSPQEDEVEITSCPPGPKLLKRGHPTPHDFPCKKSTPSHEQAIVRQRLDVSMERASESTQSFTLPQGLPRPAALPLPPDVPVPERVAYSVLLDSLDYAEGEPRNEVRRPASQLPGGIKQLLESSVAGLGERKAYERLKKSVKGGAKCCQQRSREGQNKGSPDIFDHLDVNGLVACDYCVKNGVVCIVKTKYHARGVIVPRPIEHRGSALLTDANYWLGGPRAVARRI